MFQRHRPAWAAALALALALQVPTSAADPAPQDVPQPTVIVLSWDGLRHDYPDLHSAEVPLPGLARVATDGARAERLIPVFPSNTFPGHVALATGTYPDRHGIPDNVFLDRQRGLYRYSPDANWLDAEPLWIAAERQGIRAATYFWVGSETDWRGQRPRYREAPFDGDRPESAKVDRILEWLALPPAERPRLIMSYWAGADDAGHRYGPDSAEVRAALVDQDRALVRLLEALDAMRAWRHTTLLVVSDHGMLTRGDSLDLPGALAAAGIEAQVFGGTVGQVFLADPGTLAAAERVARGLGSVQVYQGAKLPAAWRLAHPTRTGDLVVVADPPYTLDRPPGLKGQAMAALQALGSEFGMHGYDPMLPEMGGVFMALGRGVPAGQSLGLVRQIDVAATVAALLGMAPPLQSAGEPVQGFTRIPAAVQPPASQPPAADAVDG
ncbi:MAG: ectonucleotide pyrophosphatase/phosphodiesterase [Gammaproteobacteria bacterium]